MPKKPKKSSARTKKTRVRSSNPRGQPIDAEIEFQALLQLIDLEPSNRPYQGQLKKPIVRASKLDLMRRGSPDEQELLEDEENTRILLDQFDKLVLLLDHFKIPKTHRLRWFLLAFHLAMQHVDGMKIAEGPKPGAGRKAKWKGVSKALDLLTDVTQVRREQNVRTAEAIRILRMRHPDSWGRDTQRNLENRVSNIRSKLRSLRCGDPMDNLKVFFGLSARKKNPEKSDS